MTESVFIKKIHALFEHLIDTYHDGDKIDGDVKALKLLCHNFLEIKKMSGYDDESNKH